MNYALYVCDTETTGLNPFVNDVIEVSFCRLSDNIQKTWKLKPFNIENIQLEALKINGHKLEDLLYMTSYGKETYREPTKVIIEIENWIMEDSYPCEKRILIGQNVMFDKYMLENLWSKCEASDSFPFGRRYLDTMQIQFFMDFCKDEFLDSYSLTNIIKKYGIKNSRAHTAEADTVATKELFEKQVEYFRKILNIKS